MNRDEILKKLNILYIDSNYDGDLIKNLSSISNIYDAKNYAQAKELMDSFFFDIVFAYARSENDPIIEALEELRDRDKDISIVLVTDAVGSELLLKVMSLRLEDVLIKPLRFDSILDVVEKFIDKLLSQSLFELRFETGYRYNLKHRKFYFNDDEVALSKKESELFDLLFANRNKVVTYSTIENIIWNSVNSKKSSLKILINKLRKKVGKESIAVEYEIGYKLKV